MATEEWEQEADAMDDVTLAQALSDAIAMSANHCVMVTMNAEGHFIISHGVDGEAEDN